MYRIPLVRVALVRDSTVPAAAKHIGRPLDAVAILRTMIGDADREEVAVLYLDVKNRVVAAHIVAIGTLSAAPVSPREVFKTAILANAAGIIVGHNHPSGDVVPSPSDRAVAAKLLAVGRLLDIPVLDFLIVSGTAHTSLAETSPLSFERR